MKTSLVLICLGAMGAAAARAQAPQPSSLAVTWITRTQETPPAVEDARTTAAPAPPGRLAAFGAAIPQFWNPPHGAPEEQERCPALALTATLKDVRGQPLAFQPVGFALKTLLGELDLGVRPTDGEGKAEVEVKDRRYGEYDLVVAYRGDGDHQAAQQVVRVNLGPKPAPTLPASGVLISPGFSPSIGLPFLFFYGSMWCVFAYCLGYLMMVKLRRVR